MAEGEYIRLMNCNYLQFPVEAVEPLVSYRQKMLMHTEIPGLLSCKSREWNGQKYLLYDVSSMQDLQGCYEHRTITEAELLHFLYSLVKLGKKLEEYLLNLEQISLYPAHIFLELDRKEYFFLYRPVMGNGNTDEESSQEEQEALATFLLAVADHTEEAFVEILYEFYDKMLQPGRRKWIEELCARLEAHQRSQQEADQKACQGLFSEAHQKSSEASGKVFTRNQQEPTLPKHRSFEEDSLFGTCQEAQREAFPDNGYELQKRGWFKKLLLCWGAYFIILSGGIFTFLSNYVLDTQETVWLIAGAFLVTAVIMWGSYCMVKRHDVQQDGSTDENPEEAGYGFVAKQEEPYGAATDAPFWELKQKETEDYGKTQYFEGEQIQNKLYGVGKYGHSVILLEENSVVLGKKKDAVDVVLEDSTVSRRHARFFRQEGRLYIEDLNSTNGTFKNGIPLLPHQKMEVFPEDEIRFGRLEFVFR